MFSTSFRQSASSRGITVQGQDTTGMSSSPDYKIILPPLPSGVIALNTVFLHADVSARPYRVDDFHPGLEAAGVLNEVLGVGPYQFNHLWTVTLTTLAAKHRLLQASELTAKGKRCLVLDPNKAAVRIRLHWVPYHLPNISIRDAFEKFGKVEELTRDTWRVGAFQGLESTTRNVRLVLHDGVTLEQIPHELLLQGCAVLVVVPGRPPICLRCRHTGHIRRDCRAPRCNSCGRFGHVAADCARTYATVAYVKEDHSLNEALMDQQEAEETAAGGTTSPLETPPVPSEPIADNSMLSSRSALPSIVPVVDSPLESSEANGKSKELPATVTAQEQPVLSKKEDSPVTTSTEHQSSQDDEPLDTAGGMDGVEHQFASPKRPLEEDVEESSTVVEGDPASWTKVTGRKIRTKTRVRPDGSGRDSQ